MVSMYFQLARLEGSSSQPRLVIVLWPPADLIITRQRQHSPALLLWRLPRAARGCWQRHQCMGIQQEGRLHRPRRLPQHGAVLHAGPGPCLYQRCVRSRKGCGRAMTSWEGNSIRIVTEACAMERAVGLSCPSADTGTSRARAEDW